MDKVEVAAAAAKADDLAREAEEASTPVGSPRCRSNSVLDNNTKFAFPPPKAARMDVYTGEILR